MNISDDRVLITDVICEEELDVENRKRRVDIDRQWLIDSGASSHYIKDISKFRAYKWLPKPVKINIGKGPIWGIAREEVDVGIVIGKVVIGDVLLVPDLDVESDLLSVTALMWVGFGANFERGLAEIHTDKQMWGVASPTKNDGGLCYLEEYEKVQHYALAIQCIDTQTLQTWHKRLEHLNSRAIKSLVPIVTGIKIGDSYTRIGERNIDCIDCLKGMQCQTIYRFPFTKATRPLERVSADIAGPMKCSDCTWNYKYLLIFIDHHTRYT